MKNLGTGQNTRQTFFLLFYDNELSSTKYKDRIVYNLYSTNPLPYSIWKCEESHPGLVLRYCTKFQAPACNSAHHTLYHSARNRWTGCMPHAETTMYTLLITCTVHCRSWTFNTKWQH